MTESTKILLAYTSREGQTTKIMQKIAEHLQPHAEVVLHQLVEQNDPIELDSFSIIIIGSSIRYGHYPKTLKKWIDKNTATLNQKTTAFIGVNLVARKPNKNTPETNLYTKKFLGSLAWKPTISAVFAGALYYPRYNWLDKNMIRLIMWMGKGETDVSKEIIEYTNWQDVEAFAEKMKDYCSAQ